MTSTENIFVIVPAYNEAASVIDVIRDLLDAGYQTVVVDDGSTDDTYARIKELPVYLLRHEINLGQGAALQTGIRFALMQNAVYLVTFDADGQHRTDDIAGMINVLDQRKADIIFGSRFLKDAVSNLSFTRKIILQVARYINFLFTGILLSDAHNGIRAFTRPAAEKITIRENRMAHATEILFEVKKAGLSYLEFPVTVNYTRYSKQKGQKLFHSIKILQDLFFYKIFKK